MPNVHLVLDLQVTCPPTGDLSLLQAPLPSNLSLVPEPQAPPSCGFPACLLHPAPPSPRTPQQSPWAAQ